MTNNTTEQDIIALISKEPRKQALKGSQHLVYFLQNVLELTFEDTYLMLSRYGDAKGALFCEILGVDHQNFMKDADLNQLIETYKGRTDSKYLETLRDNYKGRVSTEDLAKLRETYRDLEKNRGAK